MYTNGTNKVSILISGAMKYGFFLGITVFLSYLICNSYKLSNGGLLEVKLLYYGLIPLVWLVGIIVLAFFYRNRELKGYINFLHAFSFCIYLCFFTALILSILLLIVSYIDKNFLITYSDEYHRFFMPFYDKYYAPLPSDIGKSVKPVFEQAQESIPKNMKGLITEVIVQATTTFGLFFGVIAALIVKRKRPTKYFPPTNQ